METYKFSDYDEAIKVIKKLKKSGHNPKLIQFTIDFDNDSSITKKTITTEEGCFLVKRSKTIIMNEDTYLPHMQLYSTIQNDLENIISEGVMHDIFFANPKT